MAEWQRHALRTSCTRDRNQPRAGTLRAIFYFFFFLIWTSKTTSFRLRVSPLTCSRVKQTRMLHGSDPTDLTFQPPYLHRLVSVFRVLIVHFHRFFVLYTMGLLSCPNFVCFHKPNPKNVSVRFVFSNSFVLNLRDYIHSLCLYSLLSTVRHKHLEQQQKICTLKHI